MKLTITGNQILNTGFAMEDGTILFETESPWALRKPITVIKRFHPEMYDSEVLAEITRGIFDDTVIKFKDGKVLKRTEYLRRRGFSSQALIALFPYNKLTIIL
jgi:hypothetical protein